MTDKPNRLQSILPVKGEAPRPPSDEIATRTPSPPAPIEDDTPPTQRLGMGVKSLTLRLPEDEYQRLRNYAFKNHTTHQEVLAKALSAYLRRAKA